MLQWGSLSANDTSCLVPTDRHSNQVVVATCTTPSLGVRAIQAWHGYLAGLTTRDMNCSMGLQEGVRTQRSGLSGSPRRLEGCQKACYRRKSCTGALSQQTWQYTGPCCGSCNSINSGLQCTEHGALYVAVCWQVPHHVKSRPLRYSSYTC
jgi:hypothetical protein